MLDIDAIEARLKATTPGEWIDGLEGADMYVHVTPEICVAVDLFGRREYAQGREDICGSPSLDWDLAGPDYDNWKANSKFIVQAHNHDMPELIAEMRRWYKVALALKQYLEKTPNFDVLDERYLEPTLNLFSALAETDGWSKADDVESIENETREEKNDG